MHGCIDNSHQQKRRHILSVLFIMCSMQGPLHSIITVYENSLKIQAYQIEHTQHHQQVAEGKVSYFDP